jgi:hypothetical protein
VYYILTSLIIAFGLNLFSSIPALFKQLNEENFTNLPAAKRDLLLYGSDLAAYDFIQNHYPITHRLAFLIPDEYYQARGQYFLFPRSVQYLYRLTDFAALDPNSYDLIMVYLVSGYHSGVIQGLTHLQQLDAWSPAQLYQSLSTQSLKDFPESTPQLEQMLDANQGFLIFESSSL